MTGRFQSWFKLWAFFEAFLFEVCIRFKIYFLIVFLCFFDSVEVYSCLFEGFWHKVIIFCSCIVDLLSEILFLILSFVGFIAGESWDGRLEPALSPLLLTLGFL